MDENIPLDEPLPYPTRPLFFPNGECVDEFIIPEEDKEIVLAQLYPFSPVPKLTDIMYDLHAGKTFTVKDFRVTWEHGMNYLVSPHYPESGGTVIDWVGESWGNTEDGDEEASFDELDDLDLDEFNEDGDEDRSPF
ncbi:MAG TPA: hypothetical protein VK897_27525 [Anaerolineales bacterium]|nr:hypothetical protein [Anaerolineales bacterium]